MIDITKKYRTRAGHEVRILMTDGGDWHYSVIAAYKANKGRWWPLHLTTEGKVSRNGNDDPRDLVEIKPRIQLERWMVVRRTVFGDVVTSTAPTEGMARELMNTFNDVIALAKVKVDVEEGHGL